MSDRANDSASAGGEVPNDVRASDAEGGTSDKLEKAKPKRKIIRVLTVLAYVLSVSLAAIMLSLYYVFLWDPKPAGGPRYSKRIAEMVDYPDYYSSNSTPGGSGSVQFQYQQLPLTNYILSQSVAPTVETPVDRTPRS